MSTASVAERRFLPRGWADLFVQLAIWFGFLAAYQVARGMADRKPAEAFDNGLKVVDIERRASGLWELSLQSYAHSSDFLTWCVSATYWLSQFTVLGLALLFVYLRRNGSFTRFRNTIMLANIFGLLGYVLIPTAPPRMFPELGFVDTLSTFGGLNHGSGLIELAANPYAAMPSLHSADALIVGVVMATIVRRAWAKALWLAWPAWVWFAVMATGNHFWLDVVAGVALAIAAGAFVYRAQLRAAFVRP
ncbi:MAG TPA: phosphatase PAP2 family protein [Gaiellaceae bacterium]|nr:phosphatase PAP2 family protein [Gaiellaceae bacterium]